MALHVGPRFAPTSNLSSSFTSTLGRLTQVPISNQIGGRAIFVRALLASSQISCNLPIQRICLAPPLSCRQYHNRATMATSRKIVLSPEDHGVFHWKGITKESAAKASEVLQENHDKHHITFNAGGFHSELNLSVNPQGLYISLVT